MVTRGAKILASIALPAVAGATVLLLSGVSDWPPWLVVLAIAGASGAVSARRGRDTGHPRQDGAAPLEMPVYAMQRPLRTVPARGVPADAAYTAVLTTRTQLALVVAPSDIVGPEGHWVPATGHNLTLTVSAPLSGPVTVRSIGMLVRARTPFPGSVGLSMATSQMPHLIFSPDLLESLQRSRAAYRPLPVPDAAIFLDAEPPDIGMLRPLDPPPFEVPPGETVSIAFAPVTATRAWVRWSLHCEIECGDRADTVHWDLSITAETGMGKYIPGGKRPDQTSVWDLYRDHWDPDNDVRGREADWSGAREINLAAHVSADGKGFLRGPVRQDPDPEPAGAAALRTSGDGHLAEGRLDQAADAYRTAAETGSGLAAYNLGILLQRQGDLAGARRWLLVAARKRVPTAFNDIGAVTSALGEVDQAERWFRQAMDEGDWIAAVNLAKLHAQQGRFADAEEILQPAAAVDVPGAARTLAQIYVGQGRLDDAEAVLAQDAAKAPEGGIHPREPVHDRLFRLAQFHLDHTHDVTRALDALRPAVESPATPLDAIATAAAVLDHLIVVLATGAGSRLADAIQAAALRVAAHRRLFASAPVAGRLPYDRAIEDQIALFATAGDDEAMLGAMIELTNLRGGL